MLSVSLQSLVLGYFIGLGEDASTFKTGQFKEAEFRKSCHFCLCKTGTLPTLLLHRDKYSQSHPGVYGRIRA